jgi:hypothetical protein
VGRKKGKKEMGGGGEIYKKRKNIKKVLDL